MTNAQLRIIAKQMNCSVREAREKINAAADAHNKPEYKAAFEEFEGLRVMAILHSDEGDEIISMKADMDRVKLRNSKDVLLNNICTKPWAHRMDQVSSAVLEYLKQTNAYRAIIDTGIFNAKDHGIVINFYEDDPDKPGTYSSRQVFGLSVDKWNKALADWQEQHKDTHLMNPHLLNTTGATIN